MQVTLTGSFNRQTLRNTGSSVVQAGDTLIGVKGGNEYIQYFEPASGEAFDADFRNTIKNGTVKLQIKAKGEVVNSDGGVYVRVFNADVFDSRYPQDTWNTITVGLHKQEDFACGNLRSGEQKDLAVTITNAATVTAVLSYGFAMYAQGLQNSYTITSAVLEITGESTEPAPVIAIDTGVMQGTYTDGVYYHPAGDADFYAGITYSQSLGVAMESMRYTVKDGTGAVVHSGQTTALKFLMPRSLWEEIPASGTIEFTAVSAHGIPSAAVALPWVIAHRDVRVVSPVSGTILDTEQDLVVRWETTTPAGMPSAPNPSRYTVWPAWDDETEFTTAYAVAGTSYTITADTFAGHTKLRLLILDEYGSSGSRVVRRQGDGRLIMLYLQPTASMSGITVTPSHSDGTCYPVMTVSWESEGQTAFRVSAGDYLSEPIWGSATSYRIPKVFDDGVVEIRVRIQDANGRWKDWSEPAFVTVQNRPSSGWQAQLSAAGTEKGVRLRVTGGNDLAYADVLVYRDGVMIAQLPGTGTMEYTYEDTMAGGECRYYVRMMMPEGHYAQTETVTIDAKPSTDGIILADGTWIPLRYTQDFPRRYNITSREETYQRYYAGRAYPVSIRSGRKSRQVSMEYIDKGHAICSALEREAGSVVIYKTVLGDVIQGELNQVMAGKGSLYSTVSFKILECDHTEAIEYV